MNAVDSAREMEAAARMLRDVAPDLTGPLACLADPFAQLLEERAWVAANDPGAFGTRLDTIALNATRKINGTENAS